MHIGIDARISRGWKTGVGRIAVELASRFASTDEVTLISGPRTLPFPSVRHAEKIREIRSACDAPSLCQFLGHMPWSNDSADVWLFTHPLSTPFLWKPAGVGMILDIYPLLFPKQFPRLGSLYYRHAIPLVERSMHAVVTISESSRQDAIRHLGLNAERVTSVHLGVSEVFNLAATNSVDANILNSSGLNHPYIAYCGNLRPHKNVPRLIEAYASAVTDSPRLPHLILVGADDQRRGSAREQVQSQIDELHLRHRVRILGEVTDELLAAIYRNAEFVVMPSLYEGFGLPALEAMACGTALVCSKAGALQEVANSETAIIIDPYDVNELSAAIRRLAYDSVLRRELAAAGLERAKAFTWERTASEIRAILVRASSI